MNAELISEMFQANTHVSLTLGIFGGMIGAVAYQLADALIDLLINCPKPAPASVERA